MIQSVLGSLILGYRPLWNRARKLAAIQLYVHSEASALVDTAHQRGLKLVWRGELGRLPEPDIAQCFDNSLLTLRPEDAVAALKAAPAARPGGTPTQPARTTSPVLAGQMYENICPAARSWSIAWTSTTPWHWPAGP